MRAALRWGDHRSRSAGLPGEPPERGSEQAGEVRSIYRNPGQNNWQRGHKWLREDDYMSLPVLRPRRSSCLGRPEVASSVVKVVWEKRGAMLCGFCPRGPKAVLETPVRVRCESSA